MTSCGRDRHCRGNVLSIGFYSGSISRNATSFGVSGTNAHKGALYALLSMSLHAILHLIH